MRILIADDDFTTRRLLQALLASTGHEVLEANDGEAAWQLLQNEGAHLLITDWLMPRLDGPDLIRRVRAADRPSYTYIIVLTSRDSKADLIKGLDFGADDYLTKPFDPDELRARVAIGARILSLETSLREARDRYAFQATHDQLTGLFNRPAITGHVVAELSRAGRAGYPLSLALVDVDNFKQINDQYGHLVGDQALIHVAATISDALRPYDWVGRWGGEEFLVVLAGTTLAHAAEVADRLRTRVAATPLPLAGGGSLALTVSVGVSSTELGELPADPDDLFRRADTALYIAKRAGRNQVRTVELQG